MQRHSRNVHDRGTDSDPSPNIHTNMTFRHSFSMMVTGPSASGKTEWTRKVQVGKDQEKAQSEKDSHSKNRGGKKPN